jgi:hypothetical protein
MGMWNSPTKLLSAMASWRSNFAKPLTSRVADEV